MHYTGGEPTVRRDFLNIMRAAKEVGFEQQIVTTNGYRLFRIIEDAVDAGLTRVIVSCDTLDEQRNLFVTRANFFTETLRGIERCVELLSTMTKMNCGTMRSTLKELASFVDFAADLNSRGWPGQLAIKLNQFFPSNPAQLSDAVQEFLEAECTEEDQIIAALQTIDDLRPIPLQEIEGDNPSYHYYEVGDTGVKVAVLAMWTWNYPCGGCWKLRISPQGLATICISQKNPPVLWGMSLAEKRAIFARLTGYRDSPQFDIDNPDRQHYQPQLGELRFDKVVGPQQPIAFFETIKPRTHVAGE